VIIESGSMSPRDEPGARRRDLACVLVLAALPLLILGPALVSGKVVSAADNLLDRLPWQALAPGYRSLDPTMSDVSQLLHPNVVYAAAEVRAGRLPLWNPYSFAGVPFFANPLSTVLFPLTALAYVLPVPTALTVGATLKLSGAGVATFWFLRVLALSPMAALVGGVAFMLSGPVVAWLMWPFSSTMVFLPLLFGFAERLRANAGRWPVVGLAIVVALDLLAGYPHGAFQGIAAASAWTLVRARASGAPVTLLLRWTAGVALGGLLAAVQLVPFLEYLRESAVFAYRAQWIPTLAVPVRSALTALMPYFYGRGPDYVGDWHFNIASVFIGSAPLVLVPVVIFAAWRHPATRFFGTLALATASINYGVPLVGDLASLPVMSLMRNLMLSHLVVFSVCVLAAVGADALGRGEVPRWVGWAAAGWVVALVWVGLAAALDAQDTRSPSIPLQYAWFVAGAAAAAVCVLRRLRPDSSHGWDAGLVAVQALSALPFAVTYNPVIEARWFYPTPPLLGALQDATRDLSRVVVAGSTGSVYRLFEAQGFDGMTPRRIEDVVGAIGSGRAAAAGLLDNPLGLHGDEPLSPVKVVRSPVFDLLGLRYVVVGPLDPSPRPGLVLQYAGSDGRIWRNDAALPRAFVVFSARCVDDPTGLRLMREGRVRFADEVLLADCERPAGVSPPAPATARVEHYEAAGMTIAVRTDASAYLVVADAWFPGWQASRNGEDVPILRANHAFRAIWLPPGDHKVELRYRPVSIRIGASLSGVGVGLLVLGLVLPGKRRRD
jgi:Bacterial membrane protein YfhO